MRFAVLGPLLVHADDREIPIPAARQRSVLALLLLAANRLVPAVELIDAVWDEHPPPAAGATLRNYVMRLRRACGPEIGAVLLTRPTGYLIRVEPSELDVLVCDDLCRRGRDAARRGDWETSAAAFTTATALYRGTPLVDVPAVRLQRDDVPRLVEVRLLALEGRIEADLRRGRASELIGELRTLVATEPLRERFHAQLMLALYRCARQAEALDVYQRLHATLVDELGVEPAHDIARLHQQILRAAPELDDVPAPAVALTVAPSRPRPAQLPADVATFAGRAAEIDALTRRLHPDAPSRVCVVAGMGGVGKTTLAVHVAHLLRGHFPEGQLHIDLCGALPAPLRAHDVIARFLRDLGLPADSIPADEQEQAALYRSLLDGRRVMIVLDNAANTAQVLPLIPGSAGCAVLVTSRVDLAGLPGAYHVQLGALARTEAEALLDTLVGARWTAAEPQATSGVLTACAGLPLAIQIAAGRLASRPNWSVRTLADRLADQRRRLDELQTGDLAVRVSFMVSYGGLQPRTSATGRMFRLLSLTGPSVSAAAAAALAGQPLAASEQVLEALLDAHLVESPGPGRYRLHDLLGVYAAEQAHADESPAALAEAANRLLRWYLHTAAAAARVVSPHRRHIDLDPREAPDELVHFADYDDALAWLDTEYDNLIAAVWQAAGRGIDDITWRLPVTMWDVFLLRGHYQDWVDTLGLGIAAARRLHDRPAEARVLGDLAAAYDQNGQSAQAVRTLLEALPISRELGDRRSIAAKLANLGVSYGQLDRFADATAVLREALAIYQDIGHRPAEANTYNNLGWVAYRTGQCEPAIADFHRAIEVSRSIGDDYTEAKALVGLSAACRELGRLDEAVTWARAAVDLNHKVGNRAEEGHALHAMGRALARRGEYEPAHDAWCSALDILSDLHDPQAREVRDALDCLHPEADRQPSAKPRPDQPVS